MMEMGVGFKHRVKADFVQWQRRTIGGGAVETFGLRVKEESDATQVKYTIIIIVNCVIAIAIPN